MENEEAIQRLMACQPFVLSLLDKYPFHIPLNLQLSQDELALVVDYIALIEEARQMGVKQMSNWGKGAGLSHRENEKLHELRTLVVHRQREGRNEATGGKVE